MGFKIQNIICGLGQALSRRGIVSDSMKYSQTVKDIEGIIISDEKCLGIVEIPENQYLRCNRSRVDDYDFDESDESKEDYEFEQSIHVVREGQDNDKGGSIELY